MTFDFFIFGDRIFTNLSPLGNAKTGATNTPLINNTIYTDIQNYIDQLSQLQNSNPLLFSAIQHKISIGDIIKEINEHWEANKKESPEERSDFIIDAPQKQFLPLIASHSLNKDLVDYFYNLNNDDINNGLISNPLLKMEQITTLIEQNPNLAHHLIQDTSYNISSELLHFLVSRDLLNSQENNEYHFSSSIVFWRSNLTEQDIMTILPALSNDDISKIIVNQDLPQYIIESWLLNKPNVKIISYINIKYWHQKYITDRLTNIITNGKGLLQVFN